jgi:hypothetical protein
MLLGLVFVGCQLARTEAFTPKTLTPWRDISMRPFSPLPSTRGRDQDEGLKAWGVIVE